MYHLNFSKFLFGVLVDLIIIIFLSAVIGVTFYQIAVYLGVPKLGKALVFSTLAIVSALVFSSGTFKNFRKFHTGTRAKVIFLTFFTALIVLLFYFDQHAIASVLLGMLVSLYLNLTLDQETLQRNIGQSK